MNHILRHLNDKKLKDKLRIIYIFCVIIPLIVTDSVIIVGVISSVRNQQKTEMRDVAVAVDNVMASQLDRAEYMSQNVYLNQHIYDYLEKNYASPADYHSDYTHFMNSTFFLGNAIGADRTQIFMYADNPTLVNGGRFRRIDSICDEPWYKIFDESGDRTMLMFYYDEYRYPLYMSERKILFIRRLDYYLKSGVTKVFKMEVNYSNMAKSITDMNLSYPVYVCQGDRILFSNNEANNIGQDFMVFTKKNQVRYTRDITLYGQDLQIYVLKKQDGFLSSFSPMMPLVFALVIFNICIPWIMMDFLEKSITERIRRLETAFSHMDGEHIEPIAGEESKDEIGSLMVNYNKMAERMNDLIQTVYKDKLHEQEISIARQKAELLALHSQINPHFLFNALESIRMHSVLKEESETADMIQNLAVMQRQYVDWGNDIITISQEIDFVEAYLSLQKYRFGDRLSYELDVDEDCKLFNIPKLTIVTFVENSCVHGIESKATNGWLFVRIYKKDKYVCIEVEDTGGGISEQRLEELRNQIDTCSIASLMKNKNVGIINACMRMKMATANQAIFSIESEIGIGTSMQILIPEDVVIK